MAKNTAQQNAFNALGNILSTPKQKQDQTKDEIRNKVDVVESNKDSFVRNTYMVRESYKTKMKIASAKSNIPLQTIMDEAIGAWLESYEKRNGAII